MMVASLILVEPSLAGNLGAAMRVAANFGVPRIDLVRPMVDPAGEEVLTKEPPAGFGARALSGISGMLPIQSQL